jgi:hypothetical protein
MGVSICQMFFSASVNMTMWFFSFLVYGYGGVHDWCLVVEAHYIPAIIPIRSHVEFFLHTVGCDLLMFSWDFYIFMIYISL